VKSIGCSDGREENEERNPRSGMYSPNGTSCRFTYIGPGPPAGVQSCPTFRRGLSSTSPTSTGRPIAATALAIWS